MEILQPKECSVLPLKGVREPLMQACIDLKRLKEICIVSHAITVLSWLSIWLSVLLSYLVCKMLQEMLTLISHSPISSKH